MSSNGMAKGPSTELMPGILAALDRILDKSRIEEEHQSTQEDGKHLRLPRRIHKSNNFALSFNVQKILLNVAAEENERSSTSSESAIKRTTPSYNSKKYSSKKAVCKSNDSLELLPSVQKMLSNLPDTDLVIPNGENKEQRNNLFLYSVKCEQKMQVAEDYAIENSGCSEYKVNDQLNTQNRDFNNSVVTESKNGDEIVPHSKPLGNYKHTSPCGIASRTPVGRKNIGKFLQKWNDVSSMETHTVGLEEKKIAVIEKGDIGSDSVLFVTVFGDNGANGELIRSKRNYRHSCKAAFGVVPSENSVGTNSTTSSEVSRAVSLTSLGSCSSSGSSDLHQPGSTYQASAESLDSDAEPSRIQSSADSGIADDPSANFNRKEYDVVAEIIDTETKYVEDLHKVIQDYLQPWKSDTECFLHQHIPKLFSNLVDIYEFNRCFLEQLREAKLDPSATAIVFINNTGFSIYTDYCTNYPKIIKVLTELMSNDESAKYFKKVQIQNHHDLPLGSYLLKPVQRILRYRMLLERLSERCEFHHKPVVDLALTTMTDVAAHINDMKRKHEIAIRIQEIQSQLYGWTGQDLTTLGELIAEGTFRVGGAKGRRHVFLFDKLFLLTKCKQDGNFTYKSHVMCSNLMLVEQVKGEPLSFHILPFDNPRLQVTLRAKSLQHKREWTGQLKRVIIENYNAAIPNHAQQLLMQLGQDLPEEEQSPEMWTPLKKQYSTPHYLEKRGRMRQSRDLSRRAASHDRSFPSLSNWRRKSEPDVVQQYDNKTVPSRISRLKKAKESTSTFYTNFSDSEACENSDLPVEIAEDTMNYADAATNDKNKVNKVITRRDRMLRENETNPNICVKPDKDPVISKADSLPRSFQLNDQIDGENDNTNISQRFLNISNIIVQPESPISTQLNKNYHPEHKIYRKSTIRLSLIQKYHAIKDRHRKASSKQTSKVVGARIANPDYEDPQKLFASMYSLNQSTVSVASNKAESKDVDFETTEQFIKTINEHEVLTELDYRLCETQKHFSCTLTTASSESATEILNDSAASRSSLEILNSSKNSEDGYYENNLENSLNDENVERCDSFRIPAGEHMEAIKKTIQSRSANSSPLLERRNIQKPTKAPPPIPVKPARLTSNADLINCSNFTSTSSIKRSSKTYPKNISRTLNSLPGTCCETATTAVSSLECNELSREVNNINSKRLQSKGWVKTVVGRFE